LATVIWVETGFFFGWLAIVESRWPTVARPASSPERV
jgi:hypothetical protein